MGVRRVGIQGRGEERRSRDCDFMLSGWGLSGALRRHSNTMCDACDASLYKNLIVPASNDTKESIFMRGGVRKKGLERIEWLERV